MSDNTYTGILVYEGLKGLRHERSMYLGSYGVLQEGHAPRALNQTIQEVVSNSIDEHLIGAGDEIIITIHKDNSVSIQDFGRGMPKGPDDEFTDVINSLTKPHASGKFEGNGYAATGTAGMHGIGLKATNATSKFMTLHAINHQISIDKSGKKFDTGGFEEYEITLNMENIIDKKIINKWPASEVEVLTKNSFKVVNTGEVITTGTRITYLPDDGPVSETDLQPVFESIDWVNSDLYPRFESSAFLNEGLKIQFIDERVETDNNYLVKNWYFKNGLEEYVSNVAENQTLLSKMKKPITFKEEMIYQDLVYSLQASLIITDDTDTNIRSFANSVPTKDGGPHVDGFNQAITNAINNYTKDNGLNKIKSKGKQLKSIGLFSQKDVLEGITGVFEIKLPAQLAEFEGQTKEKLATVQAKYVVNELVYKHITNWLYDNKSAAEQIITKIIESKMASDAAIKARQEAKKARVNKSMSNLKMSGKFKPASSRNPKEKELFITEGDSASNISVDRKTQAIMPIRGKIRNVHDLQLSDALTNDEISTITNILGTGIGPAFDITDLQFWKIIFAADADSDGGHILMLLITLFYKWFRPLIENGHVYVAVPPLYKATRYIKGQPESKWFYSENEMAQYRQSLIDDKYEIQRFKGLGEMSPDEVGKAIANPETRKIKQLTIEDAELCRETLNILMGDKAEFRKIWIAENLDFSELYDLI